MTAHTLGQRIFLARTLCQIVNNKKMSQEAMGAEVSCRLDRATPFSKMTVSHWEAGASEPDTATIAAIAEIAAVDPGWLAFGNKSQAPSPSVV